MRSAFRPLLWLPVVLQLACAGTVGRAQVKPETPEEQAVAFHRARAEARGDDADAWRLLAGAYVRRAEATGEPADYDRAWEVLDRAERLEPRDLRTICARAALLLSRHRFPQARALAEHGLKQYPQDPDLLAHAGDAALQAGDLDGAERHYRRLHKLSQQLSDWARLAHLAELRGDLDGAAGLLEKALESGYGKGAPPESLAWCRAVLGEVELKRGKPEVARRQYSLALEESQEHLLVLEHLAELEAREGHAQAAEAVYRKILARRSDPGIRLRLADLLEARGERGEAARLREESLRFYERAVAGGNEGFLRPLAVLYLAAGRYPQAAALAARDVALRPTAESRALLAKILEAGVAAGTPVNDLWNCENLFQK